MSVPPHWVSWKYHRPIASKTVWWAEARRFHVPARSTRPRSRERLDLSSPKNAHVDQRLRTDPIAWLGSTRPDGRPHLVPVWFCWDGNSVLIFAQPGSQKVRNLRENPRVTLALDGTKEGGDVVLVEGEATLLSGPTASLEAPAYLEKYGAMLRQMGWTVEKLAADYAQPIRITPTRFISW